MAGGWEGGGSWEQTEGEAFPGVVQRAIEAESKKVKLRRADPHDGDEVRQGSRRESGRDEPKRQGRC